MKANLHVKNEPIFKVGMEESIKQKNVNETIINNPRYKREREKRDGEKTVCILHLLTSTGALISFQHNCFLFFFSCLPLLVDTFPPYARLATCPFHMAIYQMAIFSFNSASL